MYLFLAVLRNVQRVIARRDSAVGHHFDLRRTLHQLLPGSQTRLIHSIGDFSGFHALGVAERSAGLTRRQFREHAEVGVS